MMWRRAAVRRIATTARVVRLSLPYFAFACLKHLVPTATLARWAWQAPAPAIRDHHQEHQAIAAVVRLRRAFRSRGDCLEAGLVLYRELSRRGVDARLTVGVARDGSQVRGHAWVEVDGAVVGEAAGRGNFVPAIQFGVRGLPIPAEGAATSRDR